MQNFPAALRAHFEAPRHVGEPVGGAQARGEARHPGCGDHAVLFLGLAEGRITSAGFKARGCPLSLAAGSAYCELLPGQVVEQSLPEAIAQRFEAEFGQLGAARRHVVSLWTSALRAALSS
ncbi:MAG: iron-sulfur cluster assembly scaffold protein [Planctomycetota bacterium]